MALAWAARLGELACVQSEQLAVLLATSVPPELWRARARCEAQGLRTDLLGYDEACFALAGSLGRPRPGSDDRIQFADRRAGAVDMTLRQLFDQLDRPLRVADGSTGLSEFLWSAACERRSSRRLWTHDLERRAKESFAALYERLSEPFLGTLHGLCRPGRVSRAPAVEELAADAWSHAFQAYWSERSRHRLLGEASLLTLLNTIARRLARSQATARSGVQDCVSLDALPPSAEPQEPDPLPGASGTRAERILRDALALLPPKCRLVAYLHHVNGLANSRIAELLHVERSAVSNHLRRAEALLRKQIAEEAAWPASYTTGSRRRSTGEANLVGSA